MMVQLDQIRSSSYQGHRSKFNVAGGKVFVFRLKVKLGKPISTKARK